VLTGLRGDRTVRDICREHEIAETLYYQWRDRLLEGGKAALATSRDRAKDGRDEELRDAKKRIALPALTPRSGPAAVDERDRPTARPRRSRCEVLGIVARPSPGTGGWPATGPAILGVPARRQGRTQG
jgi:transposase-like protein